MGSKRALYQTATDTGSLHPPPIVKPAWIDPCYAKAKLAWLGGDPIKVDLQWPPSEHVHSAPPHLPGIELDRIASGLAISPVSSAGVKPNTRVRCDGCRTVVPPVTPNYYFAPRPLLADFSACYGGLIQPIAAPWPRGGSGQKRMFGNASGIRRLLRLY